MSGEPKDYVAPTEAQQAAPRPAATDRQPSSTKTRLIASLGAVLLVMLYLYLHQSLYFSQRSLWLPNRDPATGVWTHDPALPRIVPIPSTFTTGSQTLCLSDDFSIRAPRGAPKDLREASTRAEERVKQTTHTYLSTTGGTELVNADKTCEAFISELVLSPGDNFKGRSIFEDATRSLEHRIALESYTLNVPVEGVAILEANSSLGMFRGLTTFEQLFYATPPDPLKTSSADKHDRRKIFTPFAPYDIHDTPAFPWRGVLLDTSRHFFPPGAILKVSHNLRC